MLQTLDEETSKSSKDPKKLDRTDDLVVDKMNAPEYSLELSERGRKIQGPNGPVLER